MVPDSESFTLKYKKLIIAIKKSENVAITKSIKTVEVASAVDRPLLTARQTLTNSPVIFPVGKNFPVAWEIQIITYDQNNVSLEFWDSTNQVNASKYKVGK